MSETSFTATTSAPVPDRAAPGPGAPAPPFVAGAHPSTARFGMIAFLASEVAFFSTLIVAYVAFAGRDRVGPTPSEALSLPLALGATACLLSSSVTVHLAERASRLGRRAAFVRWWGATIALAVVFLASTAYEWHGLIYRHHLTISRNLFGTTYYTLVGFHGLHVTAGVTVMLIMLGLTLGRRLAAGDRAGVELISWYWHFVDGVWIVVFAVVYLATR